MACHAESGISREAVKEEPMSTAAAQPTKVKMLCCLRTHLVCIPLYWPRRCQD